MPERQYGLLRVHGRAMVQVTNVCTHLNDLEHAYNGLCAFDSFLTTMVRRAGWFEGYWPSRFPLIYGVGDLWRIEVLSDRRFLDAMVLPSDRLILNAANFQSPGFWEFLGSLNFLEVLRKFLNDRHERRKDREYKEAAEKDRLELEIDMLRTKAFKEKIDALKSMGLTDHELAPLATMLIGTPLRRVEQHQSAGLIEYAELADTK